MHSVVVKLACLSRRWVFYFDWVLLFCLLAVFDRFNHYETFAARRLSLCATCVSSADTWVRCVLPVSWRLMQVNRSRGSGGAGHGLLNLGVSSREKGGLNVPSNSCGPITGPLKLFGQRD